MLTLAGDRLEIYLTVQGVPYAKTQTMRHFYDLGDKRDDLALTLIVYSMFTELKRDIELYADETE
jgi:hypothetical protein